MYDEENMIWDENPSFPKGKSVTGKNKPYSLYEELKQKLDVSNYTGDNYDKEKFAICNELYSQLLSEDCANEDKLKLLRNQAIDRLNVKFSSEHLYEKLTEFCNPNQFKQPYNKEIIDLCNECYDYIHKNKDDVLKLEEIEKLDTYKTLCDCKKEYEEKQRAETERRKKEEILRRKNLEERRQKEYEQEIIDKDTREGAAVLCIIIIIIMVALWVIARNE